MRKSFSLLLFGLLLLVVGFYGCATIMHGTRQGISISSTPTGATVVINGQNSGQTPLMLDLSRKERHLIKISLEGYEPYEMYLSRSVSGWVWGNIVFGGLIGLAVDAISGGLYNLKPDQVSAVLGQKNASLLKKDTIYIATVLKANSDWEKIGNLAIK